MHGKTKLEKEKQSESFYEIKYPKPKWIPQDIDDYFRNIPNDLSRIKYERLIEESNKQIAKFLEKILSFNYALPVEPQIIAIREWLEKRRNL